MLCQLYVNQAVARGDADIAAGRTVSHDQVEADPRRKWLLGAVGGRDQALVNVARCGRAPGFWNYRVNVLESAGSNRGV